MNPLRALAIETYRHFSTRVGNQHIASEYALERVLRIVMREEPRRILEVGLGIGSIAYTILLAQQRQLLRQRLEYYGTEDADFCLKRLRENLGDIYQEVTVFPNLQSIPPERRFGVIIIDGSDPALDRVRQLASDRAVVFIEGDRSNQTKSVRSFFRTSLHYRDISVRKNPEYGPFPRENWAGGCQVVYVRPGFRQTADWAFNRVHTAIKDRLRSRPTSCCPSGS